LADDPRARRGQLRVPVRLDAFRTGAGPVQPSRMRVLVVARHPTAMRLRLLGAGETATLSGRLRPVEAVEDAWRWRHVAAVLEADDLLAARPARIRLLRAANGLRALVLRGSDPLPPDRRALVAGFLVGTTGTSRRRWPPTSGRPGSPISWSSPEPTWPWP
jgi:hypothetical protein